ncbi:acyltransferase-domain-containing protein [Irpex rosettiformis]|uniref:Acyltransferase-domain-containing protein n=1 Tax=Irpex rosettiformis TaxID=378272 RepID=A0ACB8TRA7_9APHY|nr:acyltransferase-domain-containing protein [Irpex rosettiformis]
MSATLSRLTVGAIGLTCKTFLNIGYCSSVKVNGLENLRRALRDQERNSGRGIITVSNHISTLDDPVTWGVLPASWYFSSRMTRWTLGASDIMFTNPVFSAFFRKGQVLETFRGNGIFQPAIDTAIQKLNSGDWIHLFSEGKVNQPDIEPSAPRLLKFKWGVGRILMEAKRPPVIIPMWLTGFDKLMPEGRSFPFKYFPRRGVALSVTFGEPVREADIKAALESTVSDREFEDVLPLTSKRTADEVRSGTRSVEGWLGDSPATSLAKTGDQEHRAHETARIRSAVTAVLHGEVEALGRRVLKS